MFFPLLATPHHANVAESAEVFSRGWSDWRRALWCCSRCFFPSPGEEPSGSGLWWTRKPPRRCCWMTAAHKMRTYGKTQFQRRRWIGDSIVHLFLFVSRFHQVLSFSVVILSVVVRSVLLVLCLECFAVVVMIKKQFFFVVSISRSTLDVMIHF